MTERLVNYKNGVKMKNILILFLFASSLLSAQNAADIIDKAENIIKGKTAYGEIEMSVVTPDYERTLKMESWWEGNEKALIVIESPRREKGNKTLKIGNEMWNYLKNTETTIKVPPSMMLQSWNGSDFTNDDLVRESNLRKDYTQKILGEEKIENADCWKIQLIPNPNAPVVWGKLIYWVRKADYIPARIEYYDEKGIVKRYMEFTDIQIMDGRNIPTLWRMVSKTKEGHSTEFKILNMEFNKDISSKIFSFSELERGN